MKHLRDDVAKVISAIELPKPTVEPILTYGADQIYFRYNKQFNFNSQVVHGMNDAVIEAVRSCTDLKFNLERNEYDVNYSIDSIYSRINYSMRDKVLDFINKWGGHSNNKLTSLYKWYRDVSLNNSFIRNEAFMKDLYEFHKFTTSKPTWTEDHLKVCRSILLLIKNRYESPETSKRKTRR
jgi:hypothetical protein